VSDGGEEWVQAALGTGQLGRHDPAERAQQRSPGSLFHIRTAVPGPAGRPDRRKLPWLATTGDPAVRSARADAMAQPAVPLLEAGAMGRATVDQPCERAKSERRAPSSAG